jgi:hypothetical protein
MNAAELAGELKVAIAVRDGMAQRVAIDSTRPLLAQRLLAGKSAAEAVALVPHLYALCGRSQQVAAELAIMAARGAAGTADSAQLRRIESEMAQEYLWRVLLDWNRAIGRDTDASALAAARKALADDDRDLLRTVVERDVFGSDARQWYEDGRQLEFERWLAGGRTTAAQFLAEVQRDDPCHGACDVPLLPRFDDDETAERIAARLDADADFERLPTYDGRPAETGAAARLAWQPLICTLAATLGCSTLVRFAARLAELARIACADDPPAPLAGSVSLGRGRGLGWVETARGLLLHQIDLDGQTVSRYRIVAPTEWNFHPQGALAAATVGSRAPSAEAMRRRSAWLIESLDPCVGYALEVGHA